MGVDAVLGGDAVNLVQAQRLVRRICSKCKVDVTADVPSKTLIDIGFTPEQIGTFQVMKGRGCQACNGTGYRGQVGLFEVMEITEGIRDLIMVGATAVEIKRKALEEGMLTLRMSGLEKIKNGVTTVEEVLRENAGVDVWMPRTAPANAAETRRGRRPTGPAPIIHEIVEAISRPARLMNESRARELRHPGTSSSRCSDCPISRPKTPSMTSSRDPSPSSSRPRTASSICLRQRLFELNCSDIQTVQLANAAVEIDALRQRLFELHSYRIAYECLLRTSRSRPPMGSH